MDILHRQISQVGDKLFFLISSVEEPYYFVRMYGEVAEITVNDSVVTYRMKLLDILEPFSIILDCIANKHFRMKCIKKKVTPYLDKQIHCYNVNDKTIVSVIKKQMSKSMFDISIMTTFKTQEAMNIALEKINKYNIDKLTSRIDFLSHRALHI